jgi:hypothetical protein
MDYSNNIPSDFNWKTYLKINTDLPRVYNENDCKNHYLNHGINEKREYKKNLKNYLPKDFYWKNYLSLNNDLPETYDKNDCILHYIKHGIKENRPFKMTIDILKDTDLFYYGKTKSEINQINMMENISINNNDLLDVSYVNFVDKKYDYYDCLHNDSVIYTRMFNKIDDKFLQYKIDNNILDSLNNFIFIIDFQNGGGGTTIFLNTIVSKYKYNQTFLIARNYDGMLHLNINEEYDLINRYNKDESLLFLENYKDKISKIFVNHTLGHCHDFINKLFNLNKNIITITHDYSILTNVCQPFYHEIKRNILENPPKIDCKKYSMIITQNETNLHVFDDKIHAISELPDFKKSDKFIANDNKKIVIGIIGNLIDIKGRKIFRKILKVFKENKNLEFIVIGYTQINNFTNYYTYNNISEFNEILTKVKPNALLELSLWPETYSYTLSLAKLTKLPIFCLKKKFNSVVENRLNQYNKTYYFSTLNELKILIKNNGQNFFYTIDPHLYYNKFWDELFITKKQKICDKNNLNNKFNIKPYFIYFPQFHEIEENNQNFYKNFTDIINLKDYNLLNINNTLEEPLLSYLNIEKIEDYNLENSNIIQKQIDLLEYYNFEGFAMYYYWFSINNITNKNMIMEKVINNFFNNSVDLKNKKVFFIWANEDWSNNDAFGINKTQICNIYNETNLYENSKNLLQYFKHNNYLKIDNKPVFFIYHSYLFSDEQLNDFYTILNNMCIENEFAGVHFILNSFIKKYNNFQNFYINFNYKKYQSRVFDDIKKQAYINYKEYVNNSYHCKNNTIQTICLDFNNKPRLFKPDRLDKSTVCINNTEFDKITFINKILNSYNHEKSSDVENILLINSFNEWGENMAFEPSDKNEYYNLNLLLEHLRH